MKTAARVAAVGILLLLAASTPAWATRPANDAFAHASVIGSLPFTGDSDTTSATSQSGESTPSCDDFAVKSVWWHYTPAATQHLLAYLESGSTLSVYRGSSLASLTELGCSDYGGNLNFDVSAGQSIYIRVASQSGGGGPETLHLKKQ